MDDGDLIRLYRESELSAFEELVRKYQDRIYNLCRYMIREPRDAQDAAQDTFIKAYRGIKDFKPESSLYTWLCRIAVNTCLDYKRKSRRDTCRYEMLSEDLPSADPSPDAFFASKESTEALQAALPKLGEKFRAVIVLKEIEGLSYEEIAQVLHTSIGTVKSRLWRAREELRRLLTKKISGE